MCYSGLLSDAFPLFYRLSVIIFFQYLYDYIEWIVLSVYPEQMEYPHYTKHTENNKAWKIEKGEYGQKVYYAVVGAEKFSHSPSAAETGIEKVCCPYPQHIFDAEKYHRDNFYYREKRIKRPQLFKGLKEHRQQIQDDVGDDKKIESFAWKVAPLTYLDYFKYAFSHLYQLPKRDV